MYIEQINSPSDLKQLDIQQMNILSEEIRTIILEKVSKYGGHVGPDLGMIEATIALHYVFNSPTDKIVFDVSHQTFAHKILTGRRRAFIDNDVSEYTNPVESPHDFFVMGHTSPSVSLCCGMAKARDLRNENYNVIAVIGDGALSGGEAFEGLDNVSQIGSNMIIVVNDNHWAIAENHGGLYKNLRQLRESDGKCECNYFKALDIDYKYLSKGNDIESLIDVFESVKNINHPIVVHIHTVKGYGYKPALENVEEFHYMPPFNLQTGNTLVDFSKISDYSNMTGDYLLNKIKTNSNLLIISSATPLVMGLTPDKRELAGSQYIDVGIAEEHAVAFSSGLGKSGAKAVYGVYGTFLQRAFDQLSEDLCMQNNPALILVFLTGVYGIPDQSHQCFFDIIELSNIPNMVYLAPICKEEYFAMLEWGIAQNEHPVAIRVPTNGVQSIDTEFDKDYSKLNRYKIMHQGNRVAILAVGSFYKLAESIAALLKDKSGIDATLINPRYLSGIDVDTLDIIKNTHDLIITLEDGIIEGGYGEKIAGYYGADEIKVKNYGFRKEFVDRYTASELIIKNGMTDALIVDYVLKIIND